MTTTGPDDADVRVLLDHLAAHNADPAAVERAQAEGRLGALVVELAATGGGGRSMPDAAHQAGLAEDHAAALWRALGFGDPAVTNPALAPDEVRMLGLLASTSAGPLGQEATERLARVIGEATAKIGDAVVGAFREQVEAPSRVAGTPYAETVRAYAGLVAAAVPGLQEAVGACVRRHLVLAAADTWTLPEGESLPRKDLVVAFADLAGWTALSRAIDHADLSRLVQRFDHLVASAATRHGVRVVKLLGDGAMLVTDNAQAACAFALDLIAAVSQDEVLPPVRLGLAAGPVLPSGGDYYGATVNLAARLAAVALPSTALADDEVRLRAISVVFDAPGDYELRGLTEPMRAATVNVGTPGAG